MRGISPCEVEAKISRDVGVAYDHAALVLGIDNDGRIHEYHDGDGRLNSILIVGKPVICQPGMQLLADTGLVHLPRQVVLCEVGIGSTHPYKSVYGKESSKEKLIPRRRNWFQLAEWQYRVVAPHVFRALQERTDQKVSLWKNGSGTYVLSNKSYFMRRKMQIVEHQGVVCSPRGLTYSVPAESFFAADVAWADVYLNFSMQRQLRALALTIKRILHAHYRKSESVGKRFLKLGYVQKIVEMLNAQHMTKFHVQRMCELGIIQDRRFERYIAPFLGAECGMGVERMLGEGLCSQPSERLGNLQLRVWNVRPDYIVFKLFPSETSFELGGLA